MDKKILGNSDMEISRLGLGSWAIGGDIGDWGWGKQSQQDSINTIHAALEAGINWIDTAPAYGLGNAEKVICKALKQTSYEPFIFSKCGIYWNEGETELRNGLSDLQIKKEVDDSLSRLGVEVIDLYQIHKPSPEHQLEEAWSTLADLKQQGKVRHIGVSNFSANQLQLINEIAPITSIQPSYSLLNREIEEEILPWCLANNVGTIHHSTMSNGLLSGRMSRSRFEQLDKRDWRHKSDLYQEPLFTQNLAFVEFLNKIAHDKKCTLAQLSIAWTLAHPATTASIVGARNTDQLAGLLGATEVLLTETELRLINEYSNQL
ncbi:aldo/keto reductase [Psychromonas sp. Urea-02u-13]|uniref:aldo/keto reductase n=1 Tax=Psychromonas sp. Urea-02u-13 TaxID=2058326 RepID=UPI000C3369E9|nr:aldo/keto reductase [Psychromonas sp. Urea-02u-13]PKG37099.1 aldo/keto reductase [Psychromonas sp. Urea-02u-13]